MNKIITNKPIALICDVDITNGRNGERSEWATEVCGILGERFHVLTISSLLELETAKRLKISIVISCGLNIRWIVKYADGLNCPLIMIGGGDVSYVPFGLNNQFPALVFTTGDLFGRGLILRGMFDVLSDQAYAFLHYQPDSSVVDVPRCLNDLIDCIIRVANKELSLEDMIEIINDRSDNMTHPWSDYPIDDNTETRCIHLPSKDDEN